MLETWSIAGHKVSFALDVALRLISLEVRGKPNQCLESLALLKSIALDDYMIHLSYWLYSSCPVRIGSLKVQAKFAQIENLRNLCAC